MYMPTGYSRQCTMHVIQLLRRCARLNTCVFWMSAIMQEGCEVMATKLIIAFHVFGDFTLWSNTQYDDVYFLIGWTRPYTIDGLNSFLLLLPIHFIWFCIHFRKYSDYVLDKFVLFGNTVIACNALIWIMVTAIDFKLKRNEKLKIYNQKYLRT